MAGFALTGCLALGLPAVAQASSSPPEVHTETAEAISGGAKLKGSVNSGGLATTYYFRYASDTCDEGCTPTKTAKGGPLTGNTQQEVPAAEVTGLTAGRYWYILVATNADGTVEGGLVNFTVAATNVPVVNRLEPASGPTSGGTRITIFGNILENTRSGSVYFGSVKGRIVEEECGGICEIAPYTMLTVESPPHAAGAVDVTVENSQGNVSTTGPGDEFTYSSSAVGPPSEVVTEPVEATPAGYKLKGKLNPDGLPTTYYYEYTGSNEIECLDIEDNCWRSTTRVGPIAGDAQQEVPPIEVTGLTVGVAYRYRLVATNADRTVRGNIESFTVTAKGAPSEVLTEPAEATPNGFKLKGKLNPDGLPTTYYFEYASDTCDEGCTPTKTAVVGPLAGDIQREVPAVEVTGLTAREYWYRLVASNADGIEGGAVVMFTTLLEGPSGQAKQEPKSEPAPLVTPLAVTSPPIKTTTKYKPLTKAQKLANALKACEREPRKQWATCKRQVRKKYGKTSYKIGKQASKKSSAGLIQVERLILRD